MTFLFYFCYNLILTLALPFIWIGAYLNDKLGASLSGQKKIWAELTRFKQKVKLDPKPIVWLHAASAGEFEQIVPLLARLKDMDVYVFQTLTSATIYYKVSQSDQFDGVSFLPWDIYFRVHKFISILNPAIFINTRHDIWPNLLLALHRNNIRNVLINANLYRDSKRLFPVIKSINKIVFKNMDHMYTGSVSLRGLLKQLYSGPIDVVGDTRFDQVFERSQVNDQELISETIVVDRRVIVYGSTITSDLEVVTGAIAKASNDDKLLHIIVPHEAHERDVIPWESEFFRAKRKSIRQSEIEHYQGENIIIWNRVGQLADLYKYADLAFIGAGFTTGVHSVTEAAIYHVPSAHGPKYDILAEAIELVESGLSTVVTNSDELAAFLTLEQMTIDTLSNQIDIFTKARIGATDKVIKTEFPLN
jgi:3-deoxy-D-manno-octulosonic-acid transferase